ncbi:MAG: DNA ligase D [bacterium]|nr:DNA ligase D [bacterium]
MTKGPRKSRDRLDEYRAKRSADRTTEPYGSPMAARPGLFVVQKHAATRTHYDLRLEMGGALHSWAVPKGPSLDPGEKRLAVEVEEHPLEYAEFEGVIPEGEYGAGAVVVWDRGRWDSIGDPFEGLEKGKLLFDLHGYKLRGRWTLVKTTRGPKEWLLIKKPDGEASTDRVPGEESVRSGLTVEELEQGRDPFHEICTTLQKEKVPVREVRLSDLAPMLARTREEPFSDEDWLFELKYDGYRLLVERDGARARLRYRRGSDATAVFPELADALVALPCSELILDGEVVVLDDEGRPSFQRLQQRVHLTRTGDIQKATVNLPATLFVFDLISLGGHDLRKLPLVRRKEYLRRTVPPAGPLKYCDHIAHHGEAMFEEVRRMRLEGIMAKKADSKYVSTRSPSWLKIRADRVGDFAIVGYSPPKGRRTGFGALHLAVCEGEQLVYAGRVGTGFDEASIRELHGELDAIRREKPAFRGDVLQPQHQTWVDPELVCEVRYKEWTADNHLRHPVFLRLQPDKPLQDCERLDGPMTDEPPPAPEPEPIEKAVSFTNLTKTFWPEEGFTKGDLIEYYRSISPWILPYLVDRPIVLTRYPDGIDGKSFFQKDAPAFVPEWVRTERMWSEHAEREIHYFVCDDEETLLYLINMGSIPLHLWSSRTSALQEPDWCILDLDPKEAPFEHVIKIARMIRSLCEEIGLECFVKTSGSTGLHVLLPLGAQCSYEHSRALGELMARVVTTELPDIATITRSPSRRAGKVYVDYLQNGHGRLLVSPFCVRPLPGAPVSMPLRWTEVRRGLSPRKYDITNAARRMKRLGGDPAISVLEQTPDLVAALERLQERFGD